MRVLFAVFVVLVASGSQAVAKISGLRAYNDRGTSFFDGKRDISHAIADYTKAIDLDPKYAPPHVNRGNAYRNIGANDLALSDLKDAIALNPKDAVAFYYRRWSTKRSEARITRSQISGRRLCWIPTIRIARTS